MASYEVYIYNAYQSLIKSILTIDDTVLALFSSTIFSIFVYIISHLRLTYIYEERGISYSGPSYIRKKMEIFFSNLSAILTRMLKWSIIFCFIISLVNSIKTKNIFYELDYIVFFETYLLVLLSCFLFGTIVTIVSFGEAWSFDRTRNERLAKKKNFIGNVKILLTVALCSIALYYIELEILSLQKFLFPVFIISILLWCFTETILSILGCVYKDYEVFTRWKIELIKEIFLEEFTKFLKHFLRISDKREHIRRGMAENHVKHILGTPDKVDSTSSYTKDRVYFYKNPKIRIKFEYDSMSKSYIVRDYEYRRFFITIRNFW